MKRLTLFLLLVFGWLHAAELPNTGLAQNEYGYYGEGVTFGGYPIVGEWKLNCSSTSAIFDNSGSVTLQQSHQASYGISEDGQILTIVSSNTQIYELTHMGNSGCFRTLYTYVGDVSQTYPCDICKTTHNNKSYGPNSNSVTITVGVD